MHLIQEKEFRKAFSVPDSKVLETVKDYVDAMHRR